MRTPKLLAQNKSAIRYYAGFSSEFVSDIVDRYASPDSLVLDPWNGSGTTTAVCSEKGLKSVGLDINPAVLPVAWGRLARKNLVLQLCADLKKTDPSILFGANINEAGDSLLDLYFMPATSKRLRSLRNALIIMSREVAVDETSNELCAVSGAAFILLSRIIANALKSFRGTNPSWFSCPKSPKDRLSFTSKQLLRILYSEIDHTLCLAEKTARSKSFRWPRLVLGDSREDLYRFGTFDLVISSPPYCTRIDYPIATTPEMLALGGISATQFAQLRQKTIGTALTQSLLQEPPIPFGKFLRATLNAIANHPTKAAGTYYKKYFESYFTDISFSLDRLADVVPSGVLVLVVQNSYFKNIEIDLPLIISEQLKCRGFYLKEEMQHPVRTTIAASNPKFKIYREKNIKIEHVLVFARNAKK